MRTILAALVVVTFSLLPAFSKEIALTDAQVTDLTKLIAGNGYNCPVVKLATTKPAEAEGDVIRVYCGPDDGSDNVFSDFSYKVTFRPAGAIDVAEWE